ncbi:unnamed protein product [Lactuca saligna]|uniref:Uncharacterized protein n=1 Tax=Lactuca saligna TaxID=75948 RepID=A0AA35ZEJ0_LACSI|nr:unnamed protein product [Lactuca saligna]
MLIHPKVLVPSLLWWRISLQTSLGTLSNKDSNINMGDDTLTSAPDTSTGPPPPPSSPSPTSTIISITLFVVSPKFAGTINEHIAYLFFYQSANQETVNIEEDEMVEFAEVEFDHEEVDVDENMIMSGKNGNSLTLKSTLFSHFTMIMLGSPL